MVATRVLIRRKRDSSRAHGTGDRFAAGNVRPSPIGRRERRRRVGWPDAEAARFVRRPVIHFQMTKRVFNGAEAWPLERVTRVPGPPMQSPLAFSVLLRFIASRENWRALVSLRARR